MQWLSAYLALTLAGSALASDYSCTPSQSCWPSSSVWDAFNASIDGRLQTTIPYARSCFNLTTTDASAGSYDIETCDYITTHYTQGPLLGASNNTEVAFARQSVYGAAANLQWESCGSDDCLLSSVAPSLPLHLYEFLDTCALGRLSPMYVNATNETHVAATINFCQEHNIRMTIKNTGHDFLGRSFAGDSLALWTHNIQTLEFHPTFTLSNYSGTNGSYENIGVMGAGVVAQDAYDYFESQGMQITGGAVPSIGLAGGFGQGGGHGIFGPKYGLMVDQAVEFDVVTADGVFRTINEYNDPDLFYAMRGGGGSTYAVLINYKFQTYPMLPINIHGFQATFPMQFINTSTILRDLLTTVVTNQTTFSDAGVAGYYFLYPSYIAFYLILPEGPNGTDGMDSFQTLTKNYYDYLSSYPGITIAENKYYHFEKFSEYFNYTIPGVITIAPVGWEAALSGRLIPRSLFAPENATQLVTNFLSGWTSTFNVLDFVKPIPAQIYATTPVHHPDNSQTGVNPAWRDALWSTVYTTSWIKGIDTATSIGLQEQVHAAMDPLRELTPGGGCYTNEADILEVDWQHAFFGDNYDRLLKIKNTYDPDGFFNCWKCVGWDGANATQYQCYQKQFGGSIPA